jgi:hypothetical protein
MVTATRLYRHAVPPTAVTTYRSAIPPAERQ